MQGHVKPEPGAIVGRALEETGSTRAGEVLLDVLVN